MAASYPTSVKAFTTKQDGAGNTIFAAHVNDIQDEVVAIESGLLNGTAPLNSSITTVRTLAVSTGIFERGRSVQMGDPAAISFASTLFVAEAGNWNVSSTDVVTLARSQVGKQVTLAFDINTTDVTASNATYLAMRLPDNSTSLYQTRSVIQVTDGAALGFGVALIPAGSQFVRFFKNSSGNAWSTATDLSGVRGQIMYWTE
jgi:hypothetical protein